MHDDRKSRWSWFKSERSDGENRAEGLLNDGEDQAEAVAADHSDARPPEPPSPLKVERPDITPALPDEEADPDPDTAENSEAGVGIGERLNAPLADDDGAGDDWPDDPDVDDLEDQGSDHQDDGPPAAQRWRTSPAPRSVPRRKQPRTLTKPQLPRAPLTAEQKLLLLDTWQRSGLPARDFSALVGVSRHTLYSWKQKFEKYGPGGLEPQPRGTRQGSRLPELTKRAILMMKEAHPDWGCQRISDMLNRGPALPASAGAVAKVLHAAGYEMEERPTRRNPDRVRSFERARANQLWQTDLFSFVLKRQNRRVYLVGFMDDHSRFIVGYGLHASQSAALVIEVLRGALTAWGPPQEILTDNGAQYVTWRGKSQFTRELEKRGIRQIVAKPRRPQTLGKIERFWGTLWRECVESAVFTDLAEARQRIGLFIDHYNFQRPHQGIGGMVPADRFFDAAPEVLRTLQSRVQENALELARHGVPKQPFYLTGQVDGRPFSVHREGDRVVLRKGDAEREEIDLEPADFVDDDRGAQQASPQLPAAVTPDGSPVSGWNPPDDELPPGVSGLVEPLRENETCDDSDAPQHGGVS